MMMMMMYTAAVMARYNRPSLLLPINQYLPLSIFARERWPVYL